MVEAAHRARRRGRRALDRQRVGAPGDGRAAAQELEPFGGFTPLLYAAREGCLECAQALVAAGADRRPARIPTASRRCFLAIVNLHFDTAKLLARSRRESSNKWDWWGRTPLYSAVDFNTLPHGGRPDRPSLDDTTSTRRSSRCCSRPARIRTCSSSCCRRIAACAWTAAATRCSTSARRRCCAPRAAPTLAAIERLVAPARSSTCRSDGGITPLMAAAGVGASSIDTRGKFRTAARSARDGRRAARSGRRRRSNATRAAARRCTTPRRGLHRRRDAARRARRDLAAADADGVTPIDAANGKLRGGRRGAGAAYPATAEALQGRLTATAAR